MSFTFDSEGTPFALIDNTKPLLFTKNKKIGFADYYNAPDSELELVPTVTDERDSIFIAGPTGCGKTRFAMAYLSHYAELFPENNIFIITGKPSDCTVEANGFDNRIIDINDPAFIEDPPNIEEFRNCAILFDDVDYIDDKDVKTMVKTLAKKCIGVGREFSVTVIITSHLINDYIKTRFILGDCKYVVLFPNSGLKHGVLYFLKSYLYLSKEQIDGVFGLDSEWICVHTRAPQFILYQHGAVMI